MYKDKEKLKEWARLYYHKNKEKLKEVVENIKRDKKRKHETYITVTDDWYPCYRGNKICLSLFIFFVIPTEL